MNQGFWRKLDKPFTILAPMANVTDWAFRQVIIETGRPNVFFTEFISCDGICAIGKEKFKGELYFTENERPIVVQFFTANPEHMYKCAQLAQELGYDGIDINMGCPDGSVEKQGAGAALMKKPELAKKIIQEAIRGAGSLPVSVKTRLGFNEIDYGWIKNLIDTDIVALAVHGRTRKEMSKVPAHWDEIGKAGEMIKKSGKLAIGNGDVMSMSEVREKAKQYGLDGIMVGRGIFHNPWLFSLAATAARGQADKEVDAPKERINLLLKHLDNFEKLWPEGKNFDVMKRFFKVYINGWSGAKDLRAELMTVKSKEQALAILNKTKPA